MAAQSGEITLGSSPPSNSLVDVVSGRTVTTDEARAGRPLVVMFLCRHCPYVKHVEAEIARIGRDYEGRVSFVAISANDATSYPEDAPPSLREQALAAGFGFPYLHDESQAVARAYGAVCTPELFVFDHAAKLAYHGRLDGSRVGKDTPTGADLRAALDAVVARRAPATVQHPSVGCSIKWKRTSP
jgi:thiol-disulfide isomerase/thioredoxin